MNQHILSFDLDNVIRATLKQIIKETERVYGVHLSPKQFSIWDVDLGYLLGLSKADYLNFAFNNPDIFKQAHPEPFVKMVLDQLSGTNTIIVNTANPFQEITRNWLDQWELPYDEIVHTKDKAEVDFDWHVDDSPHVLEQLHQAGRNVIRYCVPWNEHLNGKYPYVSNWLELGKLLGV